MVFEQSSTAKCAASPDDHTVFLTTKSVAAALAASRLFLSRRYFLKAMIIECYVSTSWRFLKSHDKHLLP